MDSQDLSDWFGHLWVWAGISNMSPLLAVKTERTFGVMEITAQFVATLVGLDYDSRFRLQAGQKVEWISLVLHLIETFV